MLSKVMVNNQFSTFSINLNAQDVGGMTHLEMSEKCRVIRYSRVEKLHSEALHCQEFQKCRPPWLSVIFGQILEKKLDALSIKVQILRRSEVMHLC